LIETKFINYVFPHEIRRARLSVLFRVYSGSHIFFPGAVPRSKVENLYRKAGVLCKVTPVMDTTPCRMTGVTLPGVVSPEACQLENSRLPGEGGRVRLRVNNP